MRFEAEERTEVVVLNASDIEALSLKIVSRFVGIHVVRDIAGMLEDDRITMFDRVAGQLHSDTRLRQAGVGARQIPEIAGMSRKPFVELCEGIVREIVDVEHVGGGWCTEDWMPLSGNHLALQKQLRAMASPIENLPLQDTVR